MFPKKTNPLTAPWPPGVNERLHEDSPIGACCQVRSGGSLSPEAYCVFMVEEPLYQPATYPWLFGHEVDSWANSYMLN